MESNEKKLLFDKLDTLINLMAYQVSASKSSVESKAVLLSTIGLKPIDIAKICGTTANTISVRLAEGGSCFATLCIE